MLSRGVCPCAALFGGWKRSIRSGVSCGTYWKPPLAQGAFRVKQPWVRRSCPAATARLYLSTTHQPTTATNGTHSRLHQQDTEPEKHALLDAIQESFKCHIIPNLAETETVVLLVGVSGGCDSTGLLHALVRILVPCDNDGGGNNKFKLAFNTAMNNTSYELHVVHFNHKQRGDASNADALFVQGLCSDLGLPFHVFEWNNASNDKTASFSQDAARQWRRSTMYSLLQSLTNDGSDACSKYHGVGVILTAHHRDDSDESMLLKVLRGVHLTNLAGMKALVVDSDEMPGAIVGRPLLDVRKECIVDFLTSRGLTWREDESNASDKYLRNRVRNELIPLLNDMVGGAHVLQKRLDHVSRQSSELNDDLNLRARDYMANMRCNDVFVLSGDTIGLVEKEALHQWARSRMGFPLPYDQLELVCIQLDEHPNQRKWTLQVGKGWSIVRNGAVLSARKVSLDGGEQEAVEHVLEWSVVSDDNDDETKDALYIQLPECDIDGPPVASFVLSDGSRARKWDFTPPWRENPIELHDFLRGQKVPLHRRDCAPVLYLKRDDPILISVFVECQDGVESVRGLNGKWITDARFDASTDESIHRKVLRLQLPNDLNEMTS